MPRKSQFTIEQQLEMVELYNGGTSTVKLAEIYNAKAGTIASMIKKHVGDLRTNKENSRKFTYNNSYFNNIDTAEKAYWLGFIYADGYIATNQEGNKRFGLALAVKDIGHLEKFKQCINATYEIKTFATSGGYSTGDYCRIQIFGSEIYDDLERHGVLPNKTLILQPPTLDENLIPHFIRGYMDGDGCITTKYTKNSSKKYCVKIVGTDDILNYIKKFIEDNNIATIRKLYKRRPEDAVSNIDMGGNIQVKKFLDLIYKDATIYLDRKFEIYNELCRQAQSSLVETPVC